MSMLIEELKKEHAEILSLLDAVTQLGFFTQEGRIKLLTARNKIVAHLRKEDERLYPKLKKAAESDRNLKNTLDTFAGEMENISKIVMQFFDKYSANSSDFEFAKDFGRIIASLKIRIRQEEFILYGKYDSLTS